LEYRINFPRDSLIQLSFQFELFSKLCSTYRIAQQETKLKVWCHSPARWRVVQWTLWVSLNFKIILVKLIYLKCIAFRLTKISTWKETLMLRVSLKCLFTLINVQIQLPAQWYVNQSKSSMNNSNSLNSQPFYQINSLIPFFTKIPFITKESTYIPRLHLPSPKNFSCILPIHMLKAMLVFFTRKLTLSTILYSQKWKRRRFLVTPIPLYVCFFGFKSRGKISCNEDTSSLLM